eukprot:1043324-Prymnesium_polylepis.2
MSRRSTLASSTCTVLSPSRRYPDAEWPTPGLLRDALAGRSACAGDAMDVGAGAAPSATGANSTLGTPAGGPPCGDGAPVVVKADPSAPLPDPSHLCCRPHPVDVAAAIFATAVFPLCAAARVVAARSTASRSAAAFSATAFSTAAFSAASCSFALRPSLAFNSASGRLASLCALTAAFPAALSVAIAASDAARCAARWAAAMVSALSIAIYLSSTGRAGRRPFRNLWMVSGRCVHFKTTCVGPYANLTSSWAAMTASRFSLTRFSFRDDRFSYKWYLLTSQLSLL